MTIYEFKVKNIDGEEVDMRQYEGKILLIVNTASKCGFTPQYEGLQRLYDKFKGEGFEILGFPSNQFLEQEPGTNEEVKNFCQINYGVSFQMFEKIDVRGEMAHPLFKYLTSEAPFEGFDLDSEKGKFMDSFLRERFPEYLEGNGIKWNFTKFLIDRNGSAITRYESPVDPEYIAKDVQQLIEGA
jgi:glutathione peroxidase